MAAILSNCQENELNRQIICFLFEGVYKLKCTHINCTKTGNSKLGEKNNDFHLTFNCSHKKCDCSHFYITHCLYCN